MEQISHQHNAPYPFCLSSHLLHTSILASTAVKHTREVSILLGVFYRFTFQFIFIITTQRHAAAALPHVLVARASRSLTQPGTGVPVRSTKRVVVLLPPILCAVLVFFCWCPYHSLTLSFATSVIRVSKEEKKAHKT